VAEAGQADEDRDDVVIVFERLRPTGSCAMVPGETLSEGLLADASVTGDAES
jgi:hypothetical protein